MIPFPDFARQLSRPQHLGIIALYSLISRLRSIPFSFGVIMPKAKKSRSSNAGIAPSMPYSVGVKKEDTVRGQAQSNNNLIAPNTSIGQHFLKNPAVVNSIVQKSGVKVGFLQCILGETNRLVCPTHIDAPFFCGAFSKQILSLRSVPVQEI